MSIPFLDLTRQYENIKKEIFDILNPIFSSQKLILGEEVTQLEAEIADFCNTDYAVGVGSGSDAIFLMLMAIGISEGDEVITTPFTFFSTVSSIVRLGAKPVFVDIDSKTFNINPELIEDKITDKTKCIMPVHLYGQCADMKAINEIANKHSLIVVEDAAQAIGAGYSFKDVKKNSYRRSCSLSSAGALSFYPTKNLGAFGEAGMVVTNDKSIAEKIKMLRVHGEEKRYYHTSVGINSRLDTVQAAVLLVKLKYLEEWTNRRREIAAHYDEALSGIVEIPFKDEKCYHVYNQYVIRSSEREKIIEKFKEENIGFGIYYPLSLHLQKCFSYLGYREGDFPESEKASNEVLALPIFPELKDEEQQAVIKAIKDALKQ